MAVDGLWRWIEGKYIEPETPLFSEAIGWHQNIENIDLQQIFILPQSAKSDTCNW